MRKNERQKPLLISVKNKIVIKNIGNKKIESLIG